LCEAVLKGKLLKVTDTSSKLLPELRQMAAELGIPDAATMRKSELVEAIDQRGNGGNKSMTTNSDIPEDIVAVIVVTIEMIVMAETTETIEMVTAALDLDLENAVPEENAMTLKLKKTMYYCQ